MKKFENPIEVRVRLVNSGPDALTAFVDSSLGFSPVDGPSFAFRLLYQLTDGAIGFHRLYDGSFVSVGDMDKPFPNYSDVPSSDRAIVLSAEEYELSDGKLHFVSFTLNQSTDHRHDYVIQGVRYVRLVGVASVEVDCDEEEA